MILRGAKVQKNDAEGSNVANARNVNQNGGVGQGCCGRRDMGQRLADPGALWFRIIRWSDGAAVTRTMEMNQTPKPATGAAGPAGAYMSLAEQ